MNNDTIQFILTTMMELVTLLCAYLAARMYHQSRKVRLLIVGIPLIVNLVCYALFRTTPFFYLAIILVIIIPFAWNRKKSQ